MTSNLKLLKFFEEYIRCNLKYQPKFITDSISISYSMEHHKRIILFDTDNLDHRYILFDRGDSLIICGKAVPKKILDDIYTHDEIELVLKYGREITDDYIIQKLNEITSYPFTVNDILPDKIKIQIDVFPYGI